MKLVKVAYYKFTDTISGKLTKDYGWTAENDTASIRISFAENIPKMEKYQPVKQTFINRPKVDDLVELTKEEFERLDVSGESVTSTLRREKHFLTVEKLKSLPIVSRMTPEQIIEKLTEKTS